LVHKSSHQLPFLFLVLGAFGIACGKSDGESNAASAGNGTSGGSTGLGNVGGNDTATSVGGNDESGGTSFSQVATGLGGAAASGGESTVGGKSGLGGASGTTNVISGAGGTRVACQAPSGYRNLFVEILGKPQAEVDDKVNKAVQQLFHGTGSDQPIYYEMGTNQAYIKDINNNDVRSEGQSYGMLIAVQMDMKTEFDKLWNYAASCMRQSSTGLFAWQMKAGACSAISTGAAPDGDEYFAMALMLASRRWGDATGTDYASEAKKALKAIATQGDFKTSPAIVTFGPYMNYTDPSYVLPLFYSEWACFDTANATLWNNATTNARTYFQKVTNSNTGLAPYQSNFDGSSNGTDFNADAWRVPMNIMMDYNLDNADPWQTTWAARMATFWIKEGLGSYGNGYTVSGTVTSEGHGVGLTAVNATLAFAIPAADGGPFLQAAWDVDIPTGQYRYYDGMLYMLSMLHLSGKFNLFY
jgi:oligosaccharide reducing-end xylanase